MKKIFSKVERVLGLNDRHVFEPEFEFVNEPSNATVIVDGFKKVVKALDGPDEQPLIKETETRRQGWKLGAEEDPLALTDDEKKLLEQYEAFGKKAATSGLPIDEAWRKLNAGKEVDARVLGTDPRYQIGGIRVEDPLEVFEVPTEAELRQQAWTYLEERDHDQKTIEGYSDWYANTHVGKTWGECKPHTWAIRDYETTWNAKLL